MVASEALEGCEVRVSSDGLIAAKLGGEALV